MSASTPVLAAVIGSVVSGVISAVVNGFSLIGQYKLHQKNRKEMERIQWRRETISILRELRREALRIDVTDSNIQPVDNILNDIEGQIDLIPPEYKQENIESRLQNLVLVNHDFYSESEEMTVVDHRTQLINKSEDALDEFENIVGKADSLY